MGPLQSPTFRENVKTLPRNLWRALVRHGAPTSDWSEARSSLTFAPPEILCVEIQAETMVGGHAAREERDTPVAREPRRAETALRYAATLLGLVETRQSCVLDPEPSLAS